MENFKYAAGLIIGAFIALCGGWDLPIQVLITIMALDILMGTMRAINQRQVSSSISLRGVTKKVGILLLVGLAAQASKIMADDTVRNAAIYAFTLAEGWSILENAAAIGIFIPENLKAIFKQTNNKKFQ